MDETKPNAPTIVLFWNPDTNGVTVQMNPEQVKNPDFALCLFDMAKRVVEQQQKLQQLQALQRQQSEAQLANHVRQSLRTR